MTVKIPGSYGRTKFKWHVLLRSDKGEEVSYPVRSYWSPDKEWIPTEIMAVACVEARVESRGTLTFKAQSATLEDVPKGTGGLKHTQEAE